MNPNPEQAQKTKLVKRWHFVQLRFKTQSQTSKIISALITRPLKTELLIYFQPEGKSMDTLEINKKLEFMANLECVYLGPFPWTDGVGVG